MSLLVNFAGYTKLCVPATKKKAKQNKTKQRKEKTAQASYENLSTPCGENQETH